MHYSLNNKKETRQHDTPAAGFTLIEMLIIAPIVILALSGFIVLMVSMVGSVLATRDQTSMTYDSQDALNRIEDDIRLSARFMTTTGLQISPQGSDQNFTGTAPITNGTNSLLLLNLATTKNPSDSSRELVYYADRPYACANAQKVFNQAYFIKIAYFIKGGSLWRRTIMPTYNTNATSDQETICNAPWQQNSCSPGYAPATRCQTNDIELMKNVTSLNVNYYASSSSNTDLGPSNADTATTVKVTLNGSKTSAGRTINTTQSTRATRLNISVTPPTVVPLQFTQNPVDQSVVYTDTNVQFNVTPSLARATVKWQVLTTSPGAVWTDISGATGNTYTLATVNTGLSGYQYRAVAQTTEETAFSDAATLNVRVWTPLNLISGWDVYDTGTPPTYTTGMYTKTTAGLVMLKGLIAGGTAAFDTTVATLPTGYCPASRLTFYVGSYDATAGSGFGRVDVLANCEVHFMTGTNTWVALDSIQFLASTTTCAATVDLVLSSGWTNYAGGYPNLNVCKDATGRINTKGLLAPGTKTSGTPIGAIPAGYQPTEHRIMPAVDANRVFNSVGIYGTPTYAVVARGTTTSYLSVNVPYIANNGAVSWITPTIPTANGMTNYGSGFTTFQYGKTSDGVVMIKGLLQGGTVTNGTKVFNLPQGYRPSTRMLLPGVAYPGAHVRLDVAANGDVFIQDGGNATWIAFDSISFYAEN